MLPPSSSLSSTAAFVPHSFSSSWLHPTATTPAAAAAPSTTSIHPRPSFNSLYLQTKAPRVRAHALKPLAFWQQKSTEEVQEEVEEEEEEMSDDEREAIRLQKILDKRLVLAAEALVEDWPVYVALLVIQAIPLFFGGFVGGNFTFFWLTACTCVYLGAKRNSAVAKAGEIFAAVTTRNAVAAPFAASISLFGTYYLLQNKFDIATVYQLMTTFFGGYCLRDVLISTLLAIGVGGSIEAFQQTEAPPPPPTKPAPARLGWGLGAAKKAPPTPVVAPPTPLTSIRDPEEGELNNVKLAATGLSAAVCATYLWGPAAAVAAAGGAGNNAVAFAGAISALLAANLITSGIALQAQTTIPLKSIKPAIIFLSGLFLYDIYFVFLSPGGVMESVATSLEGPVKLLSPRAASATAPGQYPFSILGLGDIVVPGLFVGLLKRIDEGMDGLGAKNTFFKAGLAGYSLGLLLTFSANIIMQRGQPALLYIVPCLIASALGTAAVTGRWEEMWGYGTTTEEEEEGVSSV